MRVKKQLTQRAKRQMQGKRDRLLRNYLTLNEQHAQYDRDKPLYDEMEVWDELLSTSPFYDTIEFDGQENGDGWHIE